MSKQNPSAAIDALVGKVYSFQGKEFRATNACLMALARAGIDLADIEKNIFTSAAVGMYVLQKETTEEIRKALSLDGFALITAAQTESASWSPEEMAKAAAIINDIALRFSRSFTKYISEVSSGKNK